MIRYNAAVGNLFCKEKKKEKILCLSSVKKEELFELARQLKPLGAESQGKYRCRTSPHFLNTTESDGIEVIAGRSRTGSNYA